MEDQAGVAFELWKGLSPSEAYLLGVNDLGGTLFVPTREHIIQKRREIDAIWKVTLDISVRSLLRWARCYLDHQEPIKPPNDIMWAITGHLAKGGPENPLLPSLLRASSFYMEHAIRDLKLNRWPLESQMMVLQRTGALRSMLSIIPRSDKTSEPMDGLEQKVAEYEELFPVKASLGPTHRDLVSIMEEGEGHLGRNDIYPRILAELYACSERANIIEEKLLIDLYKELPQLKKTTFDLVEVFNTEPDIEDIQNALSKERGIKRDDVVPTLEGLRDRLSFWAIRRLIDFPHEIDVGIVETPDHFRPFISSGKYMHMDGLTGNTSSVLYITKEKGPGKPLSYPEMFLMLVHEELGHRAHYLNSYANPHKGVRITDVIMGLSMSSIYEGFANFREMEVLGELKDMNNRSEELLSDESRLVSYIELGYPLSELITEIDFLVSRNRVLGLLAGVADVRINSGKQTIVDFIRWAHIITGIEERTIFNAVVGPASLPGFHASQQIITRDIKELSQSMRNNGVYNREFNTWSTRLGFPPWRFLKDRILSYQDSSRSSR
jgi:hypothetical protein